MKEYKLVDFCEFDKYATQSYLAIHEVDENLNLGDITKVDETKLEPFTMIVGGSPCQDFSVAGKQKGSVWTCKNCEHEYNPLTVHWSKRNMCPECNSDNLEKTRSSLLVEWLRIIRANKPNFGIYENVKNIVGKQFKETTFKMFEDELHEYGYNTYWQVLNAKNYGIPQNRERVYLILIKKELDNGKFKFPKGFDNGLRLRDLLEEEVDEKYYLNDKQINKILNSDFVQEKLGIQNEDVCGCLLARDYKDPKCVQIKQATKQGYIECKIGGVADLSYPESKTRRGRVQDNGDTCPTITATETGVCYIEPSRTDSQKYIDNISSEYEFAKAKCQEMLDENGNLPEMFNPYNKAEITDYAPTQTTSCNRSCSSATVLKKESDYRIRKLTPKECFRLMGFTDEDFYKAKQSGTSDSQLYKQAGNSIVTNVLFEILLELHKAMPYLFDDLRLGSYFSGIGAFEKALDMLYEYINTGEVKQLNFTRPQVV